MKDCGPIAATTFVRPLDFVSGAACAYAHWLLNSRYTGYSFKAQRSSDNATTDVAFDRAGVVSNSSLVSAGGTFGTWRGADTIYEYTKYDQSGNGNNVTQTTNANQPIFTDSHYLSRPVTRVATPRFMTGTNTILKSPVNSCSVFCRMNVDNGTGSNGFFEGGNGSLTGIFCSVSNNFRMLYRSPYNNSGGDNISSSNGIVPSGSYFSYMGVRNSSASNQIVYKDNASVGTLGALGQPAMPATNLLVTYGGLIGINNMTGYIFALIAFPYALTSQQRAFLQANV